MPPMRTLRLLADREVALAQCDPPPPPAPGEVQLRVRAVGLNHIDVWGFRGMAFAKRQYPLVVGAEAAGEVVAIGDGVVALAPGDPVVPYAALVCGTCKPCRSGSENLCENPSGVRGFHIDGFAQELTNHPARLTVKIPPGVTLHDAACVPVAYATVEHMLFDNAKLEPGEWILVHAGGSGIGSIAIRIAKSIGCTVVTTVGSEDKAAKARALGADHVINYREDRFEGVVRKLTARRGVDVVFEHTGADTWAGSLLSPEARRAAGDLRRNLRPVGQHQPDAALPAAVPHHRLVRRTAGGAGARAGPHRRRRAAGDRHDIPAGGLPRRPATAGEP